MVSLLHVRHPTISLGLLQTVPFLFVRNTLLLYRWTILEPFKHYPLVRRPGVLGSQHERPVVSACQLATYKKTGWGMTHSPVEAEPLAVCAAAGSGFG